MSVDGGEGKPTGEEVGQEVSAALNEGTTLHPEQPGINGLEREAVEFAVNKNISKLSQTFRDFWNEKSLSEADISSIEQAIDDKGNPLQASLLIYVPVKVDIYSGEIIDLGNTRIGETNRNQQVCDLKIKYSTARPYEEVPRQGFDASEPGRFYYIETDVANIESLTQQAQAALVQSIDAWNRIRNSRD